MRLGGWLRLWVVTIALWAVIVALIAFDSRPQVGAINSAWAYEATEKIAEKVSAREGRTVWGFEVREGLKERYPTDKDVIGWLKEIQTAPKPHQRIFYNDVSKINANFESKLAAYPADLRLHFFNACLVWAGPSFVLFVLGYAVGWVWRGFKQERRRA